MKLSVYSVYDVKASCYSRPHFLSNDNLALRSFGDAVADKSTGLYLHVEDYKLFKVGVFDDIQGVFESFVVPEFIANASDFISLIKMEESNGQDKS